MIGEYRDKSKTLSSEIKYLIYTNQNVATSSFALQSFPRPLLLLVRGVSIVSSYAGQSFVIPFAKFTCNPLQFLDSSH